MSEETFGEEWDKRQKRQMEIIHAVAEGTWKPTMDVDRDEWGTILVPGRKLTDEEYDNYVGQGYAQQNADMSACADLELKAVNSTELLRLNRQAIVKEYNRAFSDQLEDSLDPQGVHIISAFMLHRHAAGEPVKPHYRCRVFMKTKYSAADKPVEGHLDIDTDDFKRLTDVHRVVPIVVEGQHRHLRFDFDFAAVMRKLNKKAA